MSKSICWHHNDLDGRCSAAIVSLACSGPANNHEIDYKDPVPFDEIGKGDRLFIVDFSLKPEDMNKILAKTEDVVWIDHHASASRYDYGVELDGLRDFKNKGPAACQLCWKHFFPKEDEPKIVNLIGRYDSWNFDQDSDKDVLEVYEGSKIYLPSAEDKKWKDVLSGDQSADSALGKIRVMGQVCIAYRDMYCSEIRKAFGYDAELQGHEDLKCHAMNIQRFGSQAFGKLADAYDVLIAYISDGEQTTVSLYTTKDEIDVSEIAKDFGGGGHKGASGFVVKKDKPLPFRRKK